jgi:uncharacterized cupin superfamily protein
MSNAIRSGRTALAWRLRAVTFAATLGCSVLLSVASSNSAAPRIARIDTNVAAAAVRAKYPPEMVAKGQQSFDGSFSETVAFETADKRYAVRIWESGPGILQTDGYPHDEYCVVVAGQLEITDRGGGSQTFRPGDTFMIPKGWQGTWNMKTKFRKQYIALTAAQ